MKSKKLKIGSIVVLAILVSFGGFFIFNYVFQGYNNIDNDNDNHDELPPLIEGDLWIATYHPIYEWDWDGTTPSIDNIPWSEINELILGYLFLEESSANNFSLKIPNGYTRTLAQLLGEMSVFIEEGHEHGVNITCMIGGMGSNPGNIWNDATSGSNIDQFAQNIFNILQGVGFDGINLDWEENIDYPQYVNLASKLRDLWPQAIIAIASMPLDSNVEAQLAPAKDDVDYFMPMTYLSIGQYGGWTLPVPLTPLYNDYNVYSVSQILQNWNDSGVPASKILMGVGGFGSVWGDSNDDGRGPITPYCASGWDPAEGEYFDMINDGWITQEWVTQTLNEHPGFIEGWDDMGKCSYWHAPAPDQPIEVSVYGSATADVSLIFYETPRSMIEKSNFCVNNNMLGMGFWTLSQMMDGASYPNLEAI